MLKDSVCALICSNNTLLLIDFTKTPAKKVGKQVGNKANAPPQVQKMPLLADSDDVFAQILKIQSVNCGKSTKLVVESTSQSKQHILSVIHLVLDKNQLWSVNS